MSRQQSGANFFWGVLIAVSLALVSYEVILVLTVHGTSISHMLSKPALLTAVLFYIGSQLARAARLQILILEFDRRSASVLGLYCWSALLGALLPYKSGDLVKALFVGKHLGDYLRGGMLVVVERLLDAFALLLIWGALLTSGLLNSSVPYLTMALLFFCGLVAMWFWGSADTVGFVRKLVLQTSDSLRGIRVLRLALYAESAHAEFEALIKGRWLPLLVFTLVAWACELAALHNLLSQGSTYSDAADALLQYLQHALFPVTAESINEAPRYFQIIMFAVLVVPGSLFIFSELRRWIYPRSPRP